MPEDSMLEPLGRRRRAGTARFRITLDAIPGGDAPPEIRLRQALKALLRRYRLRCTAIEELGS